MVPASFAGISSGVSAMVSSSTTTRFLLFKSVPGHGQIFEEVFEGDLQPGDIVLFPMDRSNNIIVQTIFRHAAVYCGDDEVIHFGATSTQRKRDVISSRMTTGMIAKEGLLRMKKERGNYQIYRKIDGVNLNGFRRKVKEAMNSKAEYCASSNNCIHFALSLLGLEEFSSQLVEIQDEDGSRDSGGAPIARGCLDHHQTRTRRGSIDKDHGQSHCGKTSSSSPRTQEMTHSVQEGLRFTYQRQAKSHSPGRLTNTRGGGCAGGHTAPSSDMPSLAHKGEKVRPFSVARDLSRLVDLSQSPLPPRFSFTQRAIKKPHLKQHGREATTLRTPRAPASPQELDQKPEDDKPQHPGCGTPEATHRHPHGGVARVAGSLTLFFLLFSLLSLLLSLFFYSHVSLPLLP
ncbi:uncharacterized protein LOC135992714 isoform X1 [Caloenas nicobarica]|uniref:uncharacterized protein LOC135992714 isoform X1 n=1 Tax=Caloenas nicobarica TaxID=187106 RepID=UPI0032B7C238